MAVMHEMAAWLAAQLTTNLGMQDVDVEMPSRQVPSKSGAGCPCPSLPCLRCADLLPQQAVMGCCHAAADCLALTLSTFLLHC